MCVTCLLRWTRDLLSGAAAGVQRGTLLHIAAAYSDDCHNAGRAIQLYSLPAYPSPPDSAKPPHNACWDTATTHLEVDGAVGYAGGCVKGGQQPPTQVLGQRQQLPSVYRHCKRIAAAAACAAPATIAIAAAAAGAAVAVSAAAAAAAAAVAAVAAGAAAAATACCRRATLTFSVNFNGEQRQLARHRKVNG
jgi:hypothetical protein